jgi:hypothetical protein
MLSQVLICIGFYYARYTKYLPEKWWVKTRLSKPFLHKERLFLYPSVKNTHLGVFKMRHCL